MSILLTVILLSIIGVLVGLVIGVAENRRRSHRDKPPVDKELQRRIDQLKRQFDSGLITREEYQSERDKLLKP